MAETRDNVPAPDRARTTAHLAHTVLSAAGHVARHVYAAQRADSADSTAFNLKHAATHIAEVQEHARKLIAHLEKYDPDVAAELGRLRAATRRKAALEETRRQLHADVPWMRGEDPDADLTANEANSWHRGSW
jgi:hypothetical protein